MKTRLLFPHSWKKIGWIILLSSITVGLTIFFFDIKIPDLYTKVFAIFSEGVSFLGDEGPRWFHVITDDLTNEIWAILILAGAFIVAFSREEVEDEFMMTVRLESLLWATYLNAALLLIALIFFYGIGFLYVMYIYLYSFLFIFIIRFNYIMYRAKKRSNEE